MKVYRQKLLIVLFFILLIILLAGSGYGKDSVPVVVQDVKGPVWVERDGWSYPADTGFPLLVNDKIRTGLQGSAVLRIHDRHTVRIGPSSLLSLAAVDQSSSRETIRLGLDIGEVFVEVRKWLLRIIHFQVDTPTAIAGVRGTKFLLHVDEQGRTELSVTEGTVTLTSKAGGNPLAVTKGHAAVVNPGNAPENQTEPNGPSGNNSGNSSGKPNNGGGSPQSNGPSGQGGKGK